MDGLDAMLMNPGPIYVMYCKLSPASSGRCEDYETCVHYDKCLDIAVENEWLGWTSEKCQRCSFISDVLYKMKIKFKKTIRCPKCGRAWVRRNNVR